METGSDALRREPLTLVFAAGWKHRADVLGWKHHDAKPCEARCSERKKQVNLEGLCRDCYVKKYDTPKC